jgi:hypothetical protein
LRHLTSFLFSVHYFGVLYSAAVGILVADNHVQI